MITFWRLIKFAWQDFWRNLWLTVVTVLMISLALLSVNTLVLFNVITDRLISYVEKNVDLVVFLNADAPENRVKELLEQTKKDTDVAEVKFTTAADALQQYKEKNKDNPERLAPLDVLEGNPLGPRFAVQAKDPHLYPKILERIKASSFKDLIDKTDYTDYEKTIATVSALTSKIRRGVLGLLTLFSLVAILIVFNTIRVSIYTHRDEIGVMKLVGATNMFIRLPFIFVSVAYTFVATALTYTLLYLLILILEPQLRTFFEGIDVNLRTYVAQHWLALAFWQFIGAGIINALSSTIATSRYMKV